MTANAWRGFGVLTVASLTASLSLATASATQLETIDSLYYYQGTGPTIEVTQTQRDSAKQFISVSADLGWKAEFAPAHGKQTMDKSVKLGKELSLQAVADDLANGKSVKLEGFSLGAVVVDDIARELDVQGVDMSNLEINAVSDGRQPETGALVVLQPYAPVMGLLGITTTGPTSTKTGEWTYHCIQYDAICDMVDPVADPVGAAVRLAGYFTYHNGSDPVYNYGNRDQLSSQSETVGNQTVITYEAPNPLNRLVERTIDSWMNPTPVTEPTDPSIGTIPEKVIYPDRPTSVVEEAPAAAPIPAPVPAPTPVEIPVQTKVNYPAHPPVNYQTPEPVAVGIQQAWEQATPVLEQVAPEYVQPAIDLANQFGITLPSA